MHLLRVSVAAVHVAAPVPQVLTNLIVGDVDFLHHGEGNLSSTMFGLRAEITLLADMADQEGPRRRATKIPRRRIYSAPGPEMSRRNPMVL